MCFRLHFTEHKGTRVSSQYLLAEFLHTKHHPNIPFLIPLSFYKIIFNFLIYFYSGDYYLSIKGTVLYGTVFNYYFNKFFCFSIDFFLILSFFKKSFLMIFYLAS